MLKKPDLTLQNLIIQQIFKKCWLQVILILASHETLHNGQQWVHSLLFLFWCRWSSFSLLIRMPSNMVTAYVVFPFHPWEKTHFCPCHLDDTNLHFKNTRLNIKLLAVDIDRFNTNRVFCQTHGSKHIGKKTMNTITISNLSYWMETAMYTS